MRIAGIQFACSKEKNINIEKSLKLADVAIKEGAKIISFQEIFNLQWFPRDRYGDVSSLADEVKGETIGIFKSKAKVSEVVFILPVFERYKSNFYNSTFVIDADGVIKGIYRKMHLPDIPFFEEKYYFSPGNTGFPVFETRYAKIGVQHSWDNLFPEGSRILALKGAEIIFAPTACAFKTQHIWQTVISGNAIANGLFIMRVNRVGSEEGLDFYGMSFCVNPEGEMVSGIAGASDGILLSDINFDTLKDFRREWPLFKERRPKSYREIIKETKW
ncbi:MAG: hypothetical protein N2745_02590 [Syntrophorhabdaceae bacterium]|nr:hypothetical protein [Syntrophorhabdaceae bacterium]